MHRFYVVGTTSLPLPQPGSAAAQRSHFPDKNIYIYLMLRTAVLLERLESVQSILCVHIPGKNVFFLQKSVK